MEIFDVNASELIKEIAGDFKQRLKQPEWSKWVKSGTHVERAPQNREWWFERTASVLYRVFKDGPVGTGSLRTYYGGRKNRGVRPQHKRMAGGKIIRTCLQSLEKEGLIKKGKTGREITPKGQSYLGKMAKEVKVRQKETPVQEVFSEKKQAEDEIIKKAREDLRAREKAERPKEKEPKPKEESGSK
ncbi:MAG: 30S ribosomal protein S19e [Candidatus Diapherotrites archaeon]|nr:30S ribosomal protein S19e [Candidatus Diapherotrites archaeon]